MTGNTDQPSRRGSGWHRPFPPCVAGGRYRSVALGSLHRGCSNSRLRRLCCSVVPRFSPLDYAGFIASIHADDRPVAERALRNSVVAGSSPFRFRGTSRDDRPPVSRSGTGLCRRKSRGRSGGYSDPSRPPLRRRGPTGRLAAIVTSSDDAIIGEDLNGIDHRLEQRRGGDHGLHRRARPSEDRCRCCSRGGKKTRWPACWSASRPASGSSILKRDRRRKDGAIIDVSLTISPVWDDAGRLVGASKVARDITATKRAQAELEAREAHLRSVLELDTGCDDRDR